MKEIRDIVEKYDLAAGSLRQTALATVVKVEGSSYRQPGARMLVTEDGELTGAISGGCLEGDALRKAVVCIHQKQHKLVTYDTSREEDVEFGVQLGCNGIIHLLFEYIDPTLSINPISILKNAILHQTESVITTLFSEVRQHPQPGTVMLSKANGTEIGTDFPEDLKIQALSALTSRQTSVSDYQDHISALFSYVPGPVHLVIAGAGNDVIPVTKAAHFLGWDVTVADGRATHAKAKRFPEAGCVWLGNPKSVLENIGINEQTYFVLMAHNYQYELELLKILLSHDEIPYIGILGPKTKFLKLIDDLEAAGITVSESQLNKIFAPVGLDIGAETSEEIALSIISEIKAVMHSRNGQSLKFRQDKIHSETAQKG